MIGSTPLDASVSDLFKDHLARLFPETGADKIQKAAGTLASIEFVEGQIVIQEGARSQGVLILLAGRLGIFTRDSNGHTTLIRVVAEPGALIIIIPDPPLPPIIDGLVPPEPPPPPPVLTVPDTAGLVKPPAPPPPVPPGAEPALFPPPPPPA